MSLAPAAWIPLLLTRKLGRALCHYAHTLTSTNAVLKELAKAGAPHGSLCLCEKQTAGRGRLDRRWASPEGQGVWLSVLLRPALKPEAAPLLTFCCALAMARAVRQAAGVDAGIKWPNDLVLSGRKVCGVLLELGFDAGGMFVVAGTGLNVRQAAYPPELAQQATSIEEWAELPDRGAIIAAYLNELEELVAQVEENGFAAIAADFRRQCVTLGRPVRVLGAEEFTGTAEDVDETGALLVRSGGELRRVLAADVSVRGVMGYV